MDAKRSEEKKITKTPPKKEEKNAKNSKYVSVYVKDLDDFIFADTEVKYHSEK